jgi:hypothetical protein
METWMERDMENLKDKLWERDKNWHEKVSAVNLLFSESVYGDKLTAGDYIWEGNVEKEFCNNFRSIGLVPEFDWQEVFEDERGLGLLWRSGSAGKILPRRKYRRLLKEYADRMV